MKQIFVDMDGVLADFDEGYRKEFGSYGGKEADDVDWKKVRNRRDFYLDLPPMPDFKELWEFLAPHNPIILTGVPTNVQEAEANKRAWAVKHIGDHVRLIGCKSRDKCLHGKPGDILIDDWEKYRHLWRKMGGYWITHTSARSTIHQMRFMLPPV